MESIWSKGSPSKLITNIIDIYIFQNAVLIIVLKFIIMFSYLIYIVLKLKNKYSSSSLTPSVGEPYVSMQNRCSVYVQCSYSLHHLTRIIQSLYYSPASRSKMPIEGAVLFKLSTTRFCAHIYSEVLPTHTWHKNPSIYS